MKTVETAEIGAGLPVEQLRRILRDHSVQVAILFGSHATATTHSQSDIDVAVEFDSVSRDDPAYNDAFFELSTDLSEALDTEELDLLDVRTVSPDVATSIFEHGVLLVGEQTRAEELRGQLTTATEKSPRERFDTALRKIDEHLGGSATSPADGPRGER